MKKHIALYAIAAAAFIAAPISSRAQEAGSTNSPAATAPASKKHSQSYHGKVTAVDSAAMTVTVGSKTFNVTSDTKITKEGKPATLSDITAGESVRGSYKKVAGGKLDATTIHIGDKKKEGQ